MSGAASSSIVSSGGNGPLPHPDVGIARRRWCVRGALRKHDPGGSEGLARVSPVALRRPGAVIGAGHALVVAVGSPAGPEVPRGVMVRPVGGATALVGAIAVSAFALSSGAWAKATTQHCSSYTGGSAGLVDSFTDVLAQGVGCRHAHEVLGTWANSGPGGTDLGFSCKATKASAKNTFRVRCVDGSRHVTALDAEHTSRSGR